MTCEEHIAALVAKNPKLASDGNVTLPAVNVLRMVRAAYQAGQAKGLNYPPPENTETLRSLRKMMGMD